MPAQTAGIVDPLDRRILAVARERAALGRRDPELAAALMTLLAALQAVPYDDDAVTAAQAEVDRIKAERAAAG